MAIYAKLAGIGGGSMRDGRKGWSDILSLEWGASRDDPMPGKRRAAGSARLDDFVMTLFYDKAAPVMQAYCLKGKSIAKMEVEVTRDTGGKEQTYLRYELKQVTINGYQNNAEADDDMPPVVILSSRFVEMKVIYTDFAADGAPAGSVECKYKSKK